MIIIVITIIIKITTRLMISLNKPKRYLLLSIEASSHHMKNHQMVIFLNWKYKPYHVIGIYTSGNLMKLITKNQKQIMIYCKTCMMSCVNHQNHSLFLPNCFFLPISYHTTISSLFSKYCSQLLFSFLQLQLLSSFIFLVTLSLSESLSLLLSLRVRDF
jgi:hypothetical protein